MTFRDALLPPAMAREVEALGARKAAMHTSSVAALGVLGGAFIALGAMFTTTVIAGGAALPYGVQLLCNALADGVLAADRTHTGGLPAPRVGAVPGREPGPRDDREHHRRRHHGRRGVLVRLPAAGPNCASRVTDGPGAGTSGTADAWQGPPRDFDS